MPGEVTNWRISPDPHRCRPRTRRDESQPNESILPISLSPQGWGSLSQVLSGFRAQFAAKRRMKLEKQKSHEAFYKGKTMRLFSWLKNWTGLDLSGHARWTHSSRKPAARCRLTLEELEARDVPSF